MVIITLNYIETYGECRLPHRLVFLDMDSAILDIEKWLPLMNVSISPWVFKKLEQKYSPDGKKTRMGPKYSSAVIDKLFFDIDCLSEDGRFIQKSYDSMIRLWTWATENNYKRDISFTGGGYQMRIWITNINPESYINIIHYLIKKLNLYIDENISLTDMMRYRGSYNFGKDGKSPRNCWCVCLKDYEVIKPWYFHLNLAKTRRTETYVYGNELFDPPNVGIIRKKKVLDRRSDFTRDDIIDDILGKYGFTYDDICKSMKAIIEQPHVGHYQRIYVIKYLKTVVGMSYGDVIVALPKLLTAKHGVVNDGYHSIQEGQPYSVYSRNLYFNPDKMKQMGYCDQNCTECDAFIHIALKSRRDIPQTIKEVENVRTPKIWR